jgi:thiamine biosynthesis lipoprotein
VRGRLGRRELLTSLASPAGGPAGHWIRVHRSAMACRFEVVLASEDARFVPAARAALDEIDALEAALTVFRDTSELSRVNRHAASGPVRVSEGLWHLLSLCREIHAATGGAFDPTSTPLSRVWGFLARRGRLPSPEEIEAARARVGMERVALDATDRSVSFTSPGLELNLGSIGKGWALDRIAAGLGARGLGRALLGAGGSSFLGWGAESWPVSLRPGGEPLAELRLDHAALGTSSADGQHLEVEGRRLGHVIDPRTGWPAEGVKSASAIAASAAVADALATAFLVGGEPLARAYCGEHPGIVAILVLEADPRALVVRSSRADVAIEAAEGVRFGAHES